MQNRFGIAEDINQRYIVAICFFKLYNKFECRGSNRQQCIGRAMYRVEDLLLVETYTHAVQSVAKVALLDFLKRTHVDFIVVPTSKIFIYSCVFIQCFI